MRPSKPGAPHKDQKAQIDRLAAVRAVIPVETGHLSAADKVKLFDAAHQALYRSY